MFPNPVSIIEGKKGNYLIFDAPNDKNVGVYGDLLKKEGVVLVVRTCSKTSSEEYGNGIIVKECVYDDGGVPSRENIKLWLNAVRYVFNHRPGSTIGVHCMAGLGRAPLLVAIALIEMEDYTCIDAILKVRGERKGAINQKQLTFLLKYKRSMTTSTTCIVL